MIQNFTGIVLRKRIYTENDWILTLLTESGERVEAVAKGVNSGRSRRKSHLDLMNLISGTLYQGKSKLYLQDVSCKKSFVVLKEDFDRILHAQCMLEIIDKTVLPEDPHPEIYELLYTLLHEFNEKEVHPATGEVALVKLAHALGFLPNFKECFLCHISLSEDNALWDKQSGTLSCPNCMGHRRDHHEKLPLKYRKALEYFKERPWNEHQKLKLSDDEVKRLRNFIPGLFAANMEGKRLQSMSYFV